MAVAVGERVTATKLNDEAINRVKALGIRSTSKSGITTELGVLRVDNITVKNGRIYEVWANPEITSTISGDGFYVRIRHSIVGAATTSSAVLPGATLPDRVHTGGNGQGRVTRTIYQPAADQTLSIILTLERYAGTGTLTITGSGDQPLMMTVVDLGAAVADTGVDL